MEATNLQCDKFWAAYHGKAAETEGLRAVKLGLLGLSREAYKEARRAHRSAVMAALHQGSDLRDLTEAERAEHDRQTRCPSCQQELPDAEWLT